MIHLRLNHYIKGFLIGLVATIFAMIIITKPDIFHSSNYFTFLLYTITIIILTPIIFLNFLLKDSTILQLIIVFIFWTLTYVIGEFILLKIKNKRRIIINILIFIILLVSISSIIIYIKNSGTYYDKKGDILKCTISPDNQVIRYYYENKKIAKTCFLSKQDIFDINYCDNNLPFHCNLLDNLKRQ